MPTPSPSLPPQIPKRSLAPLLLAAAAGLAALGVVVWKLTGAAPEAPAPKVAARAPLVEPTPAAVAAPEPPPPPPPDEPAAPRAAPGAIPTGFTAAKPGLTPKPRSAKRDPDCDDPCNGKETPELLSSLGAKAGQARSCYEKALSNNSMLAGRLEISVRVSRTGAACSTSVGKDELGDASVSSCVLSRFRGGKYPKPTGGCVDVSVPMSFKPAGSR
jgi:hypothetical protein